MAVFIKQLVSHNGLLLGVDCEGGVWKYTPAERDVDNRYVGYWSVVNGYTFKEAHEVNKKNNGKEVDL